MNLLDRVKAMNKKVLEKGPSNSAYSIKLMGRRVRE
jgi:hypothetical protein